MSPKGAAQPQRKANTSFVSAVPTALIIRQNSDAVGPQLNQYGVLGVIFCSRLSFLLWSILYRVFVSARNVVVKASLIVMSELSIALIVD